MELFYDAHLTTGVSINLCGHERCRPGHTVRSVRDYYLIHYIVDGKGVYSVGGRQYTIKKGEGFLIEPSVSTLYTADAEDPWTYHWVGFHGPETTKLLRCAHLGGPNLVFHNEDPQLEQYLITMQKRHNTKSPFKCEFEALGCLYLFLSKLVDDHSAQPGLGSGSTALYVEKAKEYINQNYSQLISVQEIADFIGVERSYLYRLFKTNLNISPIEYINSYKITKACEIIRSTDHTIEGVARLVGFNYLSHFVKTFKKQTNMTPMQYKLVSAKLENFIA